MSEDADQKLSLVVQAAATLLGSGRATSAAEAAMQAFELVVACRTVVAARAAKEESQRLEAEEIAKGCEFIRTNVPLIFEKYFQEFLVYRVARKGENHDSFFKRVMPITAPEPALEWKACVRFITRTRQPDQTKRAMGLFAQMLAGRSEAPSQENTLISEYEAGLTVSKLLQERERYDIWRRERTESRKKPTATTKKVFDAAREKPTGKFRRDGRRGRRALVDDPTRRQGREKKPDKGAKIDRRMAGATPTRGGKIGRLACLEMLATPAQIRPHSPALCAPEFEGPEAIARRFGIGRSTVFGLIQLGRIKSVSLKTRAGNVRGRRLVNVQSVRDYLNALATN